MARSLVKSHGDVVDIPAVAAAHTVGDVVLENGFIGVCNATVAISGPVSLRIAGRVRMKVPNSTALGQYLQLSNTLPAAPTNGALVANLATCNAVVVAAGAANTGTIVGQVMETPVNNLADVLLMPQATGRR